LQRGIDLSHWFASQPNRGTNPNKALTEDDLLLLKDLNFDHVCIPIDAPQLSDQTLAEWAQSECHLMKTIRRIAKDNNIIATAVAFLA
jgi:hypothetical protein